MKSNGVKLFCAAALLLGRALAAQSASQPPVPDGFVRIPAGTFTMGSPATEAARADDEVQHQVTVSGFYMGKYEVTVGEFRRFVNAAGYKTTAETSGGGIVLTDKGWDWKRDANWDNPYFSQGDNQPVVLVSWYDAVEYCNWRSREEGLTPAYMRNGDNVTWNRGANGYRLPTEAEWEYACRAGTSGPFSTGSNITTNQANYNGNYPYNGNAKGEYRGKTWNVGNGTANPWGLYDMHGNVYEWCWDWYGEYSGGAQTDPEGPASSGTNRLKRGGSWFYDAQYVRSADRSGSTPSNRFYYLGFRLVRP
ncbi:MAG: formylglycine-generating enzyme family protein [Treponema sp.]|jgi:formylglycine-generating enzyme required for sulfatase activity|nr:formylglycine-generating enzyme family protein [Treponema sp.]